MESEYYVCDSCALNRQAQAIVGLPRPAPNPTVRAAVNQVIVNSYAGSTIADDRVILSHFNEWHCIQYGYGPLASPTAFNSERAKPHRVDAVAGYLALLKENGSRFTDARKVSAALRRAFVLAGLNGDAWLVGGVIHRVVKQLTTAPILKSRQL